MPRAFTVLLIGVLLSPIYIKMARAQDEQQGANEFTVVDGVLYFVEGEKKKEISVPAKAYAVKRVGTTLYVALGEMGLAVYDISQLPHVLLRHIVPVSHGRVTGFLEMNGELWLQVDSTTALKLTEGIASTEAPVSPLVEPVPQVVPTATPTKEEIPAKEQVEVPSTAESTKQIRILGIYPGEVELSVGAADGVKSGDRFAVYRQQSSKHHGKTFTGEELVALVEVQSVSASNSIAQVWKGDRVHLGDRVVPAEKHLAVSNIYPRYLDNLGEVSVILRPLIAVSETGGFGMLNEITAAYWTKWMIFEVGMTPLGMGWTDEGNFVSTCILGHVGFNSRPFAIALGAGVAITSTDMGGAFMSDKSGGDSDIPNETTTTSDWSGFTRARFALSQKVRLGAKDGLNFTITNSLLWVSEDETANNYEEEQSGFVYGSTTGKVDIPIAARVNLFVEGGGGVMGYGFGALGVFAWVRGNGDQGAIGLSASGGFALAWATRERTVTHTWTNKGGVDTSTYTEQDGITVGGPMISLGAVYRFGF